MLNKPFSSIEGADINGLIESGASENINLEFKRQLWGKGDEEVREMLRDISSMANAYGGYFIIGMEEDGETGRAKKVVNIPDVENERDGVFASLMANLQPRIIGLDIRTVNCGDSNTILLIKVPDSLTLHQVTFKGLYQFWKRHDRQKSRMTYDEIKDSVLRSNSALDSGNNLLSSRRKKNFYSQRPYLMITAQPIKLETELFKIGNEKVREVIKNSEGGRSVGWHLNFRTLPFPTINGIAIGNDSMRVDFFRNGYAEVLIDIDKEGYLFENKKFTIEGEEKTVKVLRSPALVEITYSFVKKVEAAMLEVGYSAPVSYSINLLNACDFGLCEYKEGITCREVKFFKDGITMEIGPITYEFLSPEITTKDLCDRVWQAFGYENEPYFRDGKLNFD